jgi:hypothetical protein
MVYAKLHSRDNTRPRTALETTLSTLRATLALQAAHKHCKLSKNTTTQTNIIHATWEKYIEHESLPTTKPTNYETITTHPNLGRDATKRQQATHHDDIYMTPSKLIHTTYDDLEIRDNSRLNNRTTYLVTKWSPEVLTKDEIYVCTREEFQMKHIQPITYNTGQSAYEIHCG